MSSALIAIICAIVAAAATIGSSAYESGTAQNMQSDQQDFNSEEAEKNREFQRESWRENLPENMLKHYDATGASPNAAIMAALGLNPSTLAGSTASSGIASASPNFGGNFSSIISSLSEGLLNSAETENTKSRTIGQNIQNQWQPVVNQASVDKTYSEIEYHAEELNLDKEQLRINREVAYSQIGLSQSEIDKNIKQLDILGQEFENQKAKFDLIKAQTRKTNLEGDTEIERAANLAANTQLTKQQEELTYQQTIGQEYENIILKIDAFWAKTFNFDPKWSINSLGYQRYLTSAGEIHIKGYGDKISKTIFAAKKTLTELRNNLSNKEKAYSLVMKSLKPNGYFHRNYPEFYHHYNRSKSRNDFNLFDELNKI